MNDTSPREQSQIQRRSASFLLAASIQKLFPSALLAGGNYSDIDFYYDFFLPQKLDAQILTVIEDQMRILSREELKIRPFEMMQRNACEFFLHKKQPVLAELHTSDPKSLVDLVEMGDFTTSCDGPIISDSSEIGSFRLIEISQVIKDFPEMGEINITRIRGTVCKDPMALKQFLKRFEKYKKINHQVLGPQLNLFSYNEEEDAYVWHPRGVTLREKLHTLWSQMHEKQGFKSVFSSPIPKDSAHAQVFSSKSRFLEESPIRFAELSPCFKDSNDNPNGLYNASFTSTDLASIFCLPEQVQLEVIYSLQFILEIVKIFGIEYRWVFTGRCSEKSKTPPGWENAKKQLISALRTCEIEYATEGVSDEGPRINLHFIDSLGREWPGPSIGINLLCPANFDLHFQSNDGKMSSPVMICRSVFGSLEGLIALLVEKFEGDFPLWLAPEVVRVMPLGIKNVEEAKRVLDACEMAGIHTGFDARPEKLAARIHAAEQEKVPYVVIIGDNETAAGVIAVRSCQGKGENQRIKVGEFLDRIKNEVTTPINIKG